MNRSISCKNLHITPTWPALDHELPSTSCVAWGCNYQRWCTHPQVLFAAGFGALSSKPESLATGSNLPAARWIRALFTRTWVANSNFRHWQSGRALSVRRAEQVPLSHTCYTRLVSQPYLARSHLVHPWRAESGPFSIPYIMLVVCSEADMNITYSSIYLNIHNQLLHI